MLVLPAVGVLTHSDAAVQRVQRIFPGGPTGFPQTPACSLLPGNFAWELRKMSIVINVVKDHRTGGAVINKQQRPRCLRNIPALLTFLNIDI